VKKGLFSTFSLLLAFMRLDEEPDATPANRAAAEAGWVRLLERLARTRG